MYHEAEKNHLREVKNLHEIFISTHRRHVKQRIKYSFKHSPKPHEAVTSVSVFHVVSVLFFGASCGFNVFFRCYMWFQCFFSVLHVVLLLFLSASCGFIAFFRCSMWFQCFFSVLHVVSVFFFRCFMKQPTSVQNVKKSVVKNTHRRNTHEREVQKRRYNRSPCYGLLPAVAFS